MTRRSPSRALMAAVAVVVSWPILAWSGAASAAAVPYGGPYQIVLPGLPGQCMTAGQTLPGSKLWVYFDPCAPGDTRQQWEFSQSPNPGSPADARRVRNLFHNRCLDADNRGGRLTTIIHVYDCNTSPNQAWQFRGGVDAPGDACVWVAYLCDKKMIVVPPIDKYDDIPVQLVASRRPGDDLFLVRPIG